jgi:sugar phosphate isomerase/epimerase
MKLGLVTYEMAAQWDVDMIIANCREAGFEGVELRATHAHGVETSLSTAERRLQRLGQLRGTGQQRCGPGHEVLPALVGSDAGGRLMKLKFMGTLSDSTLPCPLPG